MKHSTFGTTNRDAARAKSNAFNAGERDGRRGYPFSQLDGTTDHASESFKNEAQTTSELHLAGHLTGTRVDDDRALAAALPSTASSTTKTAHHRVHVEDTEAELRAAKQRLPLSARLTISKRIATGLLAMLAIGSGAATTAALLAATQDTELLSIVIGVAVAGGTVTVGWALGLLLRRRELDQGTGGYATTSLYSTLVLCFVAVGAASFIYGVAGIRVAASAQDAYRQAQTQSISVYIPGQQTTKATSQPEPPKGVGAFVWLAFELGLVAAATGIEFLRSDPRALHLDELREVASKAEVTWLAALDGLSQDTGTLEAAISTRADHDAAASLAGQAQHTWSTVESSAYRWGSLVSRPEVGTDPFVANEPGVHPLNHALVSFPGVDIVGLEPLDPSIVQGKSATPVLSDRVRKVLADAYAELARRPLRPTRATDVPWTPGVYLELDPAVRALRDASREPELREVSA